MEKSIPKVELHIHLEGAIPHDALFALIQKYGGDPAVPDVPALVRRFEYKSFPEFIDTWIWKKWVGARHQYHGCAQQGCQIHCCG